VFAQDLGIVAAYENQERKRHPFPGPQIAAIARRKDDEARCRGRNGEANRSHFL
jgi:hypothetical protein